VEYSGLDPEVYQEIT